MLAKLSEAGALSAQLFGTSICKRRRAQSRIMNECPGMAARVGVGNVRDVAAAPVRVERLIGAEDLRPATGGVVSRAIYSPADDGSTVRCLRARLVGDRPTIVGFRIVAIKGRWESVRTASPGHQWNIVSSDCYLIAILSRTSPIADCNITKMLKLW